ncbi:hypothetical protein [Kordiimonas sp.]|uniref:hypothetical protein n=1 Tax=Kordiimonas sp. TaxID=1970157 RepID=UPI003A927845
MQNDVGYSLNLSWRLACALKPAKADTILQRLSDADPATNQCIDLWDVPTGWLIYALSADRFGTFFCDTTETLRRKLTLDGQHRTKVYVTTAAGTHPFPLPTLDFQARNAG